MTPLETARLHASDAARRDDAVRLSTTFDLHLRAASPALAATLPPHPVTLVCAAVVAVADGTQAPVAAYDAVRQGMRGMPRHDAAVGHALMAALADLLGPAFDEATRTAWSDGYVRMVETVMAARRNRMDLVA